MLEKNRRITGIYNINFRVEYRKRDNSFNRKLNYTISNKILSTHTNTHFIQYYRGGVCKIFYKSITYTPTTIGLRHVYIFIWINMRLLYRKRFQWNLQTIFYTLRYQRTRTVILRSNKYSPGSRALSHAYNAVFVIQIIKKKKNK